MSRKKKNQETEITPEMKAKIEEELQQLAEIIVDEYFKRKRKKENLIPVALEKITK